MALILRAQAPLLRAHAGAAAWRGQIGKCLLLQATPVPDATLRQPQAADSDQEDEGQRLLPAGGTESAVPQRKWFRDRQILVCLAGAGLLTLVSSKSHSLGFMCGLSQILTAGLS